MRFGLYKNKAIEQVPTRYLRDVSGWLRAEADCMVRELGRRDAEERAARDAAVVENSDTGTVEMGLIPSP